jgi:hypothetical protein
MDGGRGALRAVEELLVELGAARVVARGDRAYWQGISGERGRARGRITHNLQTFVSFSRLRTKCHTLLPSRLGSCVLVLPLAPPRTLRSAIL